MSFPERTLRRLGVRISRFQASPYEYLTEAPRYTQMTVELLGRPFRIADARSFYHSYREIFLDRIYEFKSAGNQPLILDCGSNYGTSVVFFKFLYPHARIVAVEPDPAIFELLEWNVAQRDYRGITLINKALSADNAPVHFYREGADSGRIFPISGCSDVVRTETVRLDDLLAEPVAFLKMDIEGAEGEVLCSSSKLDNVDQLFLEYHSFKGTDQSLGAILDKLKLAGFRYFVHKQFCSPRPLIEEKVRQGIDMQLNIFAKRSSPGR